MNSVLYNVFRRNARNYHFYVDEWSEKSDFVTRKTNLKKNESKRTTSLNSI